MAITQEAETELRELIQKQEFHDKRSEEARQQGFNAEAGAETRKWAAAFDRAQEIEKLGISTNEKRAVIKSLPGMTTIESSKDLGSNSGTKVGFVPKLNIYVKVEFTKFSNFMRNVRGCSGLAGKTEINDIKVITKELHDEIVSGIKGAGGSIHTASFAGMTQKSRGGQIIE